MPRIILALILALGGHVLLLWLRLPGYTDIPPKFTTVRQVTVSIARITPIHKTPAHKVAMTERSIIPKTPNIPKPEPEQKIRPLPAKHHALPVVHHRVKQRQVAEPDAAVVRALKPSIFRQEEHETSRPSAAAAFVLEAGPLYQLNSPPQYPRLARRRGWEGTVLLKVDVNNDGTVAGAVVETSSFYALLDEAALKAVLNWRFAPGTRDGRPVAMQVLVPVHFVLQGST